MPTIAQSSSLGRLAESQPDLLDSTSDEAGRFSVQRLRQQYIDYLAAKVQEYEEQKQSRHYYHGAQWTPEDIRILRNRRQPIITFNRTGRKIDQIIGLVQRLRQDAKAFPRTPDGAAGAEVATQCVRTVLDANDWQFLDPYCAGQAAIEGIGGVELKLIEGDHGDPDIGLEFVFGDDFFYDPRSFRPDFSDARYLGIAKWLDVEEAIELFPDHEDDLRTLMTETGFDLTTHADREFKWVYVNEKRVRLVEHWYKNRGKWHWAFYCSWILLDEGESPFADERNRSINRFIMFSACVDHDGDRYGFARNLKGPQDELNQRRSKALHLSNTRRLIAEKGALDDVEMARREWSRPDGLVEINVGRKVQPDDTSVDLKAQLELMQDSRNEIDTFANINPALLAQDSPDEHSGVAINMLQKAGIAELGSYLRNYRSWKMRLYRCIWNAIQRNWSSERWIRVTDDQGIAQFLQVNGQQRDQWGNTALVNQIGSLDVDIILDEGPDVANLMTDAYETLKNMPPGTIPPNVLIELMPLPDSIKKKVTQMMTPDQEHAQMQKQGHVLALQRMDAESQQKQADAYHKTALAEKAHHETAQGWHDSETQRMQAHSDRIDAHANLWQSLHAAQQQGPAQGQSGGSAAGAGGAPNTAAAPSALPQMPAMPQLHPLIQSGLAAALMGQANK